MEQIMKTEQIVLNLTLLVSVLAFATRAGAGDENWDARFHLPPEQGVNGTVNAVAVSGSNVYVGGYFTKAGTVNATNIARWDGASWSALGPGVNEEVHAIAVDDYGLVYVGGDFWQAGGVSANCIAKWDGSNWSTLGSGSYNGTGGPVYAIGVCGPLVFVGGWFTSAGGISANFIAKWDGSSWSAHGSGVYGVVRAITAADTGDIYVGGDFTTLGTGVAANHIATCRVWPPAWRPLGAYGADGVNDVVRAITVGASSSDVYVGGDFTTAAYSTPASHIAKWNGSSWSALSNGVANGVGYVVRAVAPSGTNVYVGGDFTLAGYSVIDRWNGSSWSALGSGADYSVSALAVGGTNIYVGGSFVTAGGINAHAIAKCNWDGSLWSSLGAPGLGVNDEVDVIEVANGELYVGGNFTAAGTAAAQRIGRFNDNGWSALGRLSNSVTAIAGSPPDLRVGGRFGNLGYIAEWDGIGWWPLGGGVNNTVHAIAAQGLTVYVGGDFTGGAPFNYVRKWNGSSWSALGSGVDSPVNAIAISDTGEYFGGEFWKAGGIVVNHIAKWDGSSWSALGSGVSGGWVYAVAVSGSNVYVGGNFTYAGSINVTNVARWDGTSWSALGLGLGGGVQPCVYAIAVDGTNVYVGGDFTMAGGVIASNIASWDGNRWSALGNGVNGVVHALAVTDDVVYVGGEFTTAGGKPSAHFGLWQEPKVLRVTQPTTNSVVISWPSASPNWSLQQNTDLHTTNWTAPPESVTDDGVNKFILVNPPSGNRFFRLHKP
jgi:trimeric autotransporter adhesin